jgi:4-amino-4-deoxy-L-arabinose transferase-like glycosyltransferase
MSSLTPLSNARLSSRGSAGIGVLILVFGFGALVAVISPLHDTPVQDDWDYARTVSIFLSTGLFQRSELAQATEAFTTLWGALFSKVLGFSFITLRLSTLTLSFLTVIIFFALLGELGFDAPWRVIGAATLMVSPLFVYLSFSFMTDVPALFWEIAALYLFLLALRREDARLALAASACACLAFLTRQLGLIIAIAAAAYYLFRAPRARRWSFVAASLMLPLLVVAVYGWWKVFGGGNNWADAEVTVVGTLAFLLDAQSPGVIVRRAVIYLMTLGFYLLPLWSAALAHLAAALKSFGRTKRADKIFAALGGLVFVATILRLGMRGEWMPYLTDAVTRAGLRPYLAYFAYQEGSRRPELLPRLDWIALTALTGLLGWALTVVAFEKTLRAPTTGRDPRLQLVYWTGLCLALPTLFFNGFFERYALPFLPVVIVLLLDATRHVRPSPRLAVLGLAAMAVLSVALMKDFWGWMDNRWAAAQSLVRQGIPLQAIDGGYEWDGWNLYDESMAYVRRSHVPITFNPWEYTIEPEYMITFTGLPGYHVQQEIDFDSPFGPGRIFILKRDPLSGF